MAVMVALPAIPATIRSLRLDDLGPGKMELKHKLIPKEGKMCSPNIPEQKGLESRFK
jgi:hypothetical protein